MAGEALRYGNKNTDRVKYVICKTQVEFDDTWEHMQKELIQGEYFKETLSKRGLIIFKIRDYKQEPKGQIGCHQCGGLFDKLTSIAHEDTRNDGSVYQRSYKCPKCNIDLGFDWCG